MRTTVTIDPDVAVLLKNAMRERDASFKQILNEAIRDGLGSRPAARRKPFRQLTFNLGRPLVDLTKALALSGELEDAKMIRRGR